MRNFICTATAIVMVMFCSVNFYMFRVKTQEHKLETRLPQMLQHRYSIPGPRSELLASAFTIAAKKENIDVLTLVAIAGIESSMKCNAVSHDGSTGLMGIQPKYWQNKPYNAHDCYENIFQGAFVLREYWDVTNNMNEAIMAYNVGITAHNNNIHTDRAQVYLHKVELEHIALRRLRDASTIEE